MRGELAQLGERLVCNQEVTGSIPVFSTKLEAVPWSASQAANLDANRRVPGAQSPGSEGFFESARCGMS